jgi:hypothetical protein
MITIAVLNARYADKRPQRSDFPPTTAKASLPELPDAIDKEQIAVRIVSPGAVGAWDRCLASEP